MDALDLEGLEEIAEQTSARVNERSHRGRGALFGWHASPSIERSSAAREKPLPVPSPRPPSPVPETHTSEIILTGVEITTYTELICGIQARIGELGIRQVDFDKLACWADGMSGKIFGPSQVKRLGPEKMFDAIRAAGLRLRLEPDPEQLERMRKQIAENCQPRQSLQARMGNRSHPSNKMIDDVLSYLANKRGGLTVLNDAVKEARSNWARHAAKALWEKRRACGPVDFATYLGSVSQNGARMLPPPEQRDEAATAA
jgi:hypothetical protein